MDGRRMACAVDDGNSLPTHSRAGAKGALAPIPDPAALSVSLNALPGVVENGLFLGICDLAIIGKPDGSVVELMAEEIEE